MKHERFIDKLNDLLDEAKLKAGKNKNSVTIDQVVGELIGSAFILSPEKTVASLAKSGYVTDRESEARHFLIEKCGKVFSEYANHHREKGTPEAHEKALRNESLAIECFRMIGHDDVIDEALVGRFDGSTQEGDAVRVFEATLLATVAQAFSNDVDHDLIMGSLLLRAGDIGRDHGWPDDITQTFRFHRDGDESRVTFMGAPSPSTLDAAPLPSTPADADILAMIRERAATARKKGASEAANSLDALARDIEQGLHERPIDFESFMRAWIADVAARNKAAGWWTNLRTGEPLDRNVGELLMLVTSEASEAFEAHRKSKPGAVIMDDHLPHRRGFEVEIADVFIRLGDLSGNLVDPDGNPYDVAGAMTEKLAYNAQRADHKAENRVKPGGKEL